MGGSDRTVFGYVAHRHSRLYLRKTEVKSPKALDFKGPNVATQARAGISFDDQPRPRRIDLAAVRAATHIHRALNSLPGGCLSKPQNDAAFFCFGSSRYWPTLRTPDTAIPIGFAVGFPGLVALRTCVKRTHRTHDPPSPHTPDSKLRGRRALVPDTPRYRCRYLRGGT